jgi:hypothetical protein
MNSDKEMRRWGDKEKRLKRQSPCLLLSLSPCLFNYSAPLRETVLDLNKDYILCQLTSVPSNCRCANRTQPSSGSSTNTISHSTSNRCSHSRNCCCKR